MRKVLIFAMNYWPEPTGIGPMTTDLGDYLADNGWQVTVLTTFPMAPQWQVYDGYRGRIFQRETRGKIQVVRVWVYVPPRPKKGLMKTWKRMIFDTTLATSGLPVALMLPRQGVILAVCPPLQTGLASLWLNKIWRAPVLYWLQDIVPDAAVNTGMMHQGPALWAGRWLERVVYHGVDRIGIISHGFRMNLESKGVPPDKMVFLPNWADVTRFDEGPDGKHARSQLGFSDEQFVIMHAGSVSAKQCLENVIRAMKLLEAYADIHLLIVGEGNRLDAIKDEARRLNLQRVRFLPTTTGVAYVDLLRAADVLIVNQARDVRDALIPSKLLTYLPSGRPVLVAAHPESEAARFIKEAACGVLVEPEAPDRLAEAILRLRQDPDLRIQMGIAGARFVRENYDRSVLLKRFETTLADMIESHACPG